MHNNCAAHPWRQIRKPRSAEQVIVQTQDALQPLFHRAQDRLQNAVRSLVGRPLLNLEYAYVNAVLDALLLDAINAVTDAAKQHGE